MTAAAAARLEIGLNGWTVRDLPDWSTGPSGSPRERLERLAAARYRHLQLEDHDPLLPTARTMAFELAGAARADTPAAVRALAQRHADAGFVLTTLHLGTGFESKDEARRLVEAVVDTSSRLGYPLLVETHRATLTQDPFRTIELVETFPELQINADLSHWYTGVEFVYGDMDAKLDALEPVFRRVRYVHGRIGDSGAIQVPVDPARPRPCHRHFSAMWERCFRGFLAAAPDDARIIFCPELLPNAVTIDGEAIELNYARLVRDATGEHREECDRWAQAGVLSGMAMVAFAAASASREPAN